MYGGRYNGFNTFIVGAPNYAVGQETILFLKKYRAASFGDNYGVVGLAQGKFNVVSEAGTNRKQLLRDAIDVPLRYSQNGVVIQVTDRTPVSYDSFVQMLLSLEN